MGTGCLFQFTYCVIATSRTEVEACNMVIATKHITLLHTNIKVADQLAHQRIWNTCFSVMIHCNSFEASVRAK